MKTIEDILKRKGFNFFSVSNETTVIEALKIMAENNIGSVVIEKNKKYCGILTERDYARKIILKGKKSTEQTVEEIMSTDIPKISIETTVEDSMKLMNQNNVRYLPVFKNDEMKGIISIYDLVKEIIISQEEAISQLKNYMYGN
ncbi:MAG: CBS domain-containing protein [Solirubrobacteraceae bacterium]